MKILKTLPIFLIGFCSQFLLAQSPTLPVDFESTSISYTTYGFGGPGYSAIPSEIIPNPDVSGENTSATVWQLNKPEGSEVWAGSSLPLAGAIDLSNGNIFSIKVWSPSVGTPILLKMEDSATGTFASEVEVPTTLANTWETLVFDMSEDANFDPAHLYDLVSVFPDFGNVGVVGGADFYFDDLQFWVPPLASITMPVTFEIPSLNYNFSGYGGPNYDPLLAEIIDNPNPSIANFSAKVLHLSKPEGSQDWAGATFLLDEIIDLNNGTTFSIKVLAPQVGMPINLVFQNGSGSEKAQLQMNTSIANEWELIVFDMSQATGFDVNHQYSVVALEPNLGNVGIAGASEFYFDDLRKFIFISSVQMPLTFENAGLNYNFAGYGGPNFEPLLVEVISNPNPSGENTSANVLHLSKPDGSQDWAGATFLLDEIIDLSDGAIFSMKVYAPQAGMPINLVFQNGSGAEKAELQMQTTVSNQWETLIFEMSQATGFNVNHQYSVIALEPNLGNVGIAGASEFYFDDIQKSAPSSFVQMPVTFENTGLNYNFAGYGGPNFDPILVEVISNPNPSGENTSANVLHLSKPEGSQDWAGATFLLDEIINLNNGAAFSIKVLAPQSGMPINLVFQNGSGSEKAELQVATTVANQWETLIFNMSQATGFNVNHQYSVIALEPNLGNVGIAGASEFYFDDIKKAVGVGFGNVLLEEINWTIFPNPILENATVEFTLTETTSLAIDVIDLLGKKIHSENWSKISEGEHRKLITLPNLPIGTYFFLMRNEGELIGSLKVVVQ